MASSSIKRSLCVAAGVSLVLSLALESAQAASMPRGLRGQAVSNVACPSETSPSPSPMGTARWIPTPISSIIVCPQNIPALPGQTTVGKRAVLTAKSGVRYTRLLAALSRADAPAPSADTMCPMYADLQRTIYATGKRGTWLVHIPVDECRHYQSAAVRALASIDPAQKLGM